MSKLGYTWYPKDWGNSEHVFELNLAERGFYRELIDLAMFNDNKTELKRDVWCRKFAADIKEIDAYIATLSKQNLIEIKGDLLFIPSCEARLNLVRGGKKGGEHKPDPKPTTKPILKPTPKQIEKKDKLKEKEKEIINNIDVLVSIPDLNPEIKICHKSLSDECGTSEQWLEVVAMQHKISPANVLAVMDNFNLHLIATGLQKHTLKEYKDHFSNWIKKQDLTIYKPATSRTNQLSKTNYL